MSKDELREPVFWILTTLTVGRKHGYAIIQDAATLSGGSVKLAVTTLYASIERLESEGLVQSDGDEVIGGRLRRYYIITPAGEARLSNEADRLEAKARTARSQLAQRTTAVLGGTA
jgi:DNA-binding PadR family transcriptional regulator